MEKFFYRVKKGDTLYKLSAEFSLPPVKIISLNNLSHEISEGDILLLEQNSSKVYSVRLNDTLDSIAERFNTSPEKILLDNQIPYIFYGLKIFV